PRAAPVRDVIGICIKLSPVDAHRIHVLLLSQINHHPLRMSGVVLASKKLREVRITFPVSVQVAVVKPGKTVKFRSAVAREPTMLQRIAIGMAEHLRGIRIAGEISLT